MRAGLTSRLKLGYHRQSSVRRAARNLRRWYRLLRPPGFTEYPPETWSISNMASWPTWLFDPHIETVQQLSVQWFQWDLDLCSPHIHVVFLRSLFSLEFDSHRSRIYLTIISSVGDRYLNTRAKQHSGLIVGFAYHFSLVGSVSDSVIFSISTWIPWSKIKIHFHMRSGILSSLFTFEIVETYVEPSRIIAIESIRSL